MNYRGFVLGFITGFVVGIVVMIYMGCGEQQELKKEVLVPTKITVISHTYRCVADEQCMKLAEAIYHESRGESIKGQIAVAQVIMNRVNDPSFPNTVKDVIEQPKQFSYLNSGKNYYYFEDFESFKIAKKIASDVLAGHISHVALEESKFYLNPKKVKRMPKWTQKLTQVATIGNHTFYK